MHAWFDAEMKARLRGFSIFCHVQLHCCCPLAQFLSRCIPAGPLPFLRMLTVLMTGVFAIAVSAASILALVLPSFFTLLVFRPAYIEVESTNFQARQIILLAESCARR
jgi:hypothetical protein